jgi:hypothetical protein
VVSLERGPLSLVSTNEELLGSGLENRNYGRGNPLRYPKKSVLTSPTSDGRSVGIVHSRTQATEFTFSFMASEGSLPCYPTGGTQITAPLATHPSMPKKINYRILKLHELKGISRLTGNLECTRI